MIDYELRVMEITKETAVCKPTKTYGGHMDYTVYANDKRISVSRFSAIEAWQDAYERLIGDRPKLQAQ